MVDKAPIIELWPIEAVRPYERNVKKHPPEQIQKITAAIRATGWDQPIVVDVAGVIIKGHGRRLAAIELAMDKVPVIVRRDLTPEQVKAARLNDNRAALSGFDTELLRLELADLANLGFLKAVWDDKELEFAQADLGEMNDDPVIPDLDAAVAAQEAEAKGKADAMGKRRVPLAKAFGFADIAGADEIVITRFMARAEAETGLKGGVALVAYLRQLV